MVKRLDSQAGCYQMNFTWTVTRQVNHPHLYPPTKINSALYPSRLGKIKSAYMAMVKLRGTFTCAGWQATLCDPIWKVTLHNSEMPSKCSANEIKRYILLCRKQYSTN